MFPRYAFVHVLEEMKSLECSCHDLALMQILSTVRMRARERAGGWVTDPKKHDLKLGWNHPTPYSAS